MLEAFEHPAPRDCVFVHGAGGNNLLWRRTLQYLSGDGKAIAVNLPGHPTGAITCRTVSEYADSLHRFMLDKGLKRPAVCGHSMGGAIALTLALEHPGDVGALILADTGAKMGVLPEIVDGLRGQPLGVIEKTITPMSFYQVSLEVAREGRSALSVSNLPVFLNDYLACDGFDVRDRLSQVSVRTLIVCGEGDRMTPPKWSHYLAANISRSTSFFIRGAGHMVPLEKPGPFAGILQSFLAEPNR